MIVLFDRHKVEHDLGPFVFAPGYDLFHIVVEEIVITAQPHIFIDLTHTIHGDLQGIQLISDLLTISTVPGGGR